MFKFIAHTYKEIYAWFLFNTSNGFISFGLTYLILVALQLLNVYSVVLILQKLLSISLIAFLHTQYIYVSLFILLILVVNFLFLGRIWKKNEEIKEVNNRAFIYIIASILIGAGAFAYGH
jgi:hypothetical protein